MIVGRIIEKCSNNRILYLSKQACDVFLIFNFIITFIALGIIVYLFIKS